MNSTDSPVPWRRRADLVTRQLDGGWVLKDPVAQRYFQLGPEAYFVWSRLNGSTTIGSICQEFGRHFAPRLMTAEMLAQFLGQLINQGLVWGDGSGLGDTIERRRRGLRQSNAAATLINPLAIRFRGIDPDRWLTALTRWWGWVFSVPALLISLLFLILSSGYFAIHFDAISSRLPEELAHWRLTNVFSLALVLAGLKILHELGHGIACKRYGGEVRELGVLLLVFTPCLYCNVSDAWLIPSKWKRMMISAAGMWIEIQVAMLGLWFWWISQPGWWHAIGLQMAIIGMTSTLLFNLNPLLRYDGYFILSDAWGIPNLQQRAQRELQRRLRDLCGFRPDPEAAAPTAGSGRVLAIYAALSWIYRIVIVVAILWFLDRWLEPQGWRILSRGIALLTLGSLVWLPIRNLVRSLQNPELANRWQIESPDRVILAVIGISLLLFWPLPGRVTFPLVLLPADAQGLFVTLDGELVEIVPPGTHVVEGDIVARLEQPQLERELKRLEGERELARLRVQSLSRQMIVNPRAGLQLPAARQQFEDLTEQWEQQRANVDRLSIRAPCSGIVWPTTARLPATSSEELAEWSGSPFDDRNRGCWLTAGTQLGWVGAAERLEARAVLPQTELSRLRAGQPAVLVTDLTRSRLTGTVTEISAARLSTLGPELIRRLNVPQVQDATGTRLIGAWYQLKIPVETNVEHGSVLSRGRAAVQTPPESLVARLARWFSETLLITR